MNILVHNSSKFPPQCEERLDHVVNHKHHVVFLAKQRRKARNQRRAVLEKVFHQFDSTGNGTLDEAELTKALTEGLGMEKAEAEESAKAFMRNAGVEGEEAELTWEAFLGEMTATEEDDSGDEVFLIRVGGGGIGIGLAV